MIQKQGTKTYDAQPVADLNNSHNLMVAMVGAGKRVLEFGCATGYMSRAMTAAGCKVTAIEVDPSAAAAARNFCDEVVVADLDVRSLVDVLPATPYDVAVFGDVLEHLRDPWTVLDETRKFLGPAGFVVISIPNVAHGAVRLSLLEGTFEYSNVGLLDDTHLRFFTLRTVRELCMRAGFRILEIERTKVPLFASTDVVPAVREDRFDPGVVAKIRRDPEHDTLQFVIKAVPVADPERHAWLVSQIFDLEAQLAERAEDAASAEALRADVARLEEAARLTDAHVGNLDAHIAALEGTAENLRAVVEQRESLIENLSGELAEERSHLEDARAALAAAVADTSAIRSLESEMDRERAEFKRTRDAYAETIERFRKHLENELVATRTRALEIDSAIAAIQRGPLWTLKRRLARLRGRGRAG